MTGYGLTRRSQIVEIARDVCAVIGNGSNDNADDAIVEITCAETNAGTYPDDTPYYAGAGVTQVDMGTFYWLQSKYEYHWIARKLRREFGFELGDIRYDELNHSPLLAIVFARLRYWTVPEPIPRTRRGRSKYWAEHYNTSAGKGSAREYRQRCRACDVDDLLESR